VITFLGYVYFFCSILILILLSFNYSVCNWIIRPKNKNAYIRFESIFVILNGLVLIYTTPFNFFVGLLMILHAYGVYILLFTPTFFYDSMDEFKAITSNEKTLDLIAILFYGITGFIIINTPIFF
jgi:hypothetical protein